MAADIMNHLVMHGNTRQMERLLESIKGENGIVDFNKVLPNPITDEIEFSTNSFIAFENCLRAIHPYTKDYGLPKMAEEEFNKYFAKIINLFQINLLQETKVELAEQGMAFVKNIELYGSPNAKAWCYNNWGTDKNAFGAELRSFNTLVFHTTDGFAGPIINKLAENFPRLEFEYMYANCEFKGDVGVVIFEDGKMRSEWSYKENSPRAFEITAEIMDVSLMDMGYFFDEKSGTYQYNSSLFGSMNML